MKSNIKIIELEQNYEQFCSEVRIEYDMKYPFIFEKSLGSPLQLWLMWYFYMKVT